MKAIDLAKNHFKSLHVKKIEVPEWSDGKKPFVIYVQPFTLRDQGKLQMEPRIVTKVKFLQSWL